MSIIVEAYKYQHISSWLHKPGLFYYKLFILILVFSSYIWADIGSFSLLILYIVIHYLLLRAYKLLLYSVIVYAPPATLIVLIDYIAGTLNSTVVKLLLFGYTSFISITLFYATTPIQQIYDRLGRNVLTLSLLMLHNIVAELNMIIEAKKVRGWEPGLNPYNHFLIVFEAVKITYMRIEEITTALKTRGVDE